MRDLIHARALALTAILLVFSSCAGLPPAVQTDVVIYGGTSAGVIAAVQTARLGKGVVLIEPGQHLGGLTSGGLGMTDTGDRKAIGGLSREFYRRVRKHYETDSAWRQQKASEFRFMRKSEDAIWRFEPHVAEAVFRDMIREAGVRVVFGERLELGDDPRGVDLTAGRITAIRMESGRVFQGQVFIDATYEGDLMAKAGVRYTVGREGQGSYGESLAGVQTARAVKHQFREPISGYVIPGDPASGLLPGIHEGSPGVEAAGDQRIQAYCFRMCITDATDNQVPFPKPEHYDPKRYELGLRYVQASPKPVLWHPAAMPNRKTDTNNNGPYSTDHIGANYDYPEGDYATRARIVADHENYQKGWLWFLSHDPRVPDAVAKRVRAWGLCADEFQDNGHWSHQLYVREARRMVSDFVHTELHCRRQHPTPDPIGLGSYNMDSHNVQRYVDAQGLVRNEGDIQVSPGGRYQISYRSIRPRVTECENLLVPVCVSASHAAYGSIRMEPVFMILGHAAANAACIAIDQRSPVQDVPYSALREQLLSEGQVLSLR